MRVRWWLASIFASWAFELMSPEMAEEDVWWFRELAMTFVRHAQRKSE
jgi:hypothetical protein